MERQVADLVQRGMVELADGAWSSPVVLVRKKDHSWQICIDYGRLNAVTRKDAYPLPRIGPRMPWRVVCISAPWIW